MSTEPTPTPKSETRTTTGDTGQAAERIRTADPFITSDTARSPGFPKSAQNQENKLPDTTTGNPESQGAVHSECTQGRLALGEAARWDGTPEQLQEITRWLNDDVDGDPVLSYLTGPDDRGPHDIQLWTIDGLWSLEPGDLIARDPHGHILAFPVALGEAGREGSTNPGKDSADEGREQRREHVRDGGNHQNAEAGSSPRLHPEPSAADLTDTPRQWLTVVVPPSPTKQGTFGPIKLHPRVEWIDASSSEAAATLADPPAGWSVHVIEATKPDSYVRAPRAPLTKVVNAGA